MCALRIAIDTGGTFTDLVMFDERSKQLEMIKVPSTPEAPEEGVLESIREFLEKGVNPSEVKVVLHVGTIGTNLLRGQLKLTIPKVALVTTKGFRDILEIGRQNRAELYNIFFEKPKPLIHRRLRFEVSERIGPNGEVVRPLNLDELTTLSTKLKSEGVEGVGIVFLNSYANPKHEADTKKKLSQELKRYVAASYELDPEHREYERTSTTVVNAVLQPVVSTYLLRLRRSLERYGIKAPISILSSAGGLLSLDATIRKPVAAIESGPAAGVVGTASLARLLGITHVMSFDMGGTTAKAGSIIKYYPLTVTEFELGGSIHSGRIVRGSGYPVRYPCIDLAEVSAGGGTIIWVDEVGNLKVGPMSAGALPGPACYNMGGSAPTITDANLVLGRLGEQFLGGRMKVYRDLAIESFKKLTKRLALDIYEIAAGAIRLINTHMSRSLRIVTLERGIDPRDFTLVAFGGAGPMHAAELVGDLGVSEVIVPQYPGLFTAVGLMFTDFRYDYSRGFIERLGHADPQHIEVVYLELEDEASLQLAKDDFSPNNIGLLRKMDLRYAGQGYELVVPAFRPFTDESLIKVAELFNTKHEEVYGYAAVGEPLEVTALRLTAVGYTRKPKLREYELENEEVEKEASQCLRDVYFAGEWLKTPIYLRSSLKAGNRIEGPAIVEQPDSTTVTPPGWDLKVDQYLNLRLSAK